MSFYKLEATYNVTKLDNYKYSYKSPKTYKYYFRGYAAVVDQQLYNLSRGATVKVKSISEQEYIKGTR